MAAVQADLLVLPPTADRIGVRGARHLDRLAKGCGVTPVPVMRAGRTVRAMHRSRSKMGREPTDRVRIAGPREVRPPTEARPRRISGRAARRVRISSNGLRETIFRRAPHAMIFRR